MAITVTKNFGPLANLELTTKQLMREIGLLARERIIRRTIGGRDQHDQSFRPYSAGYRKAKEAALGAGPVNLQVSGAMLNAIVLTDITDTSVTLTFNR
jgi:hypothetical protein